MRKIQKITIQGFRGFNKLNETLNFHDKLTLIAGSNSYGKTSISEALEWLLYGVTSKISDAINNRSEYDGSYRNVHFPENEIAFVEAVFLQEDGSEAIYRGELQDDDTIQRFLNGKKVKAWDWEKDSINDPRPFVLQHSLKNILLTSPSDRYQRFTKLIGEEELNNFQTHFVALSTNYPIPKEISEFLKGFSEFEEKLSELPKLEKIYKTYNKNDFDKLFELVLSECKSRVSNKDGELNVILNELKEIRGDAVSKFFDKQIILESYSAEDIGEHNKHKRNFLGFITDKFLKDYLSLAEISTIKHIVARAKFFEYGYELITKNNLHNCPLCGQDISNEKKEEIKHECEKTKVEEQSSSELRKKEKTITSNIETLQNEFESIYLKHSSKTEDFLNLNEKDALAQLESNLVLDNKANFEIVKTALQEINLIDISLKESFDKVTLKFKLVIDSIQTSTETPELIKELSDELIEYFEKIDRYIVVINNYAINISEANKVLNKILDYQAGTQELSVLIEFLEKQDKFKKRAKIQLILSNVKEFQKQVKDFVAKKLENTVKNELTQDVLTWYEKIKTDGDPDVHFDGFDLPRTKSGSIKDRKISVNAKSYGKPLPSAISSLSESKLNALGLAINIANNIKVNSTFGFIILDDPVQSMDDGHSVQVINMIRNLVEEDNKQIILLSHNKDWIKHVRKSCRSLNGNFYEITSYDQSGPNIQRAMWAAIEERITEIKALINKPGGLKSSEKQRVAEEFRLVFNELATEIYTAKTGESKNPDSLNISTLRDTLIKSDFQTKDIDNICAAYTALGDAHHKTSYDEPIQKLREYYKLVEEMKQYLDTIKGTTKGKSARKRNKD